MTKIYASELLHEVVDTTFTLFAANALAGINDAKRDLLDARINRIYEGTNEINRLFIIEMFSRRIKANQIPDQIWETDQQWTNAAKPDIKEDYLTAERQLAQAIKMIFLDIFKLAFDHFEQKLSGQQEIMMYLSNIFIAAYHVESVVLRSWKILQSGDNAFSAYTVEILHTFLNQAVDEVLKNSKECMLAFLDIEQYLLQYQNVESKIACKHFQTDLTGEKIARYILAGKPV